MGADRGYHMTDYGIAFTIPGAPVAKGRPRVTSRGAYTPKKTVTYESTVALFASEVFPKPMDGPVFLEVEFFLPRPKKYMRKKDPEGPIPCTTRPDIDTAKFNKL